MAKQIPPVRSGRSTAKKLPWVAHHQILTVLILAIAGFGIYAAAYTIQQNRQVAAERKQFMQAKVDLDDLYTKIVAAVGEPVQHKSLQYCSYTSVEIGQGERSCDMHLYLIYSISPDSISSAVSQLIKDNPRYRHLRPGALGNNNTQQDKEISIQSFEYGDLIGCYADYWSFSNDALPPNHFERIANINAGTYVDLSCGGSAKAEYYPVLSD